jgi:hypothetical protein
MLPRAAERILPRANLARVEPNWSGSLSRVKGISVCCALSVLWHFGVSFAAKWRTGTASINSRTWLPLFDAGHEHSKQTNEFAAHELLHAAAARNRYPALGRAVWQINRCASGFCAVRMKTCILKNKSG